MSEQTNETPKQTGFFFPDGYEPQANGRDYWDDDEGPDPYESAYAWANHRRALAQAQADYEDDRGYFYNIGEPSAPSDYWYGPGFASVFAEKIGGSLDSFTTLPTPPAVVAYLQETYGPKLERPDCDFLTTILREAFPAPQQRVLAALEWLEQTKAALPCWPPERIGGLIVGLRKPGPYNADSENRPPSAEAPAPLVTEQPPLASAPAVAEVAADIQLTSLMNSPPAGLIEYLKANYTGTTPKVAAQLLAALAELGIISKEQNQVNLLKALENTLSVTFTRQGLNSAWMKINDLSSDSNSRIKASKEGILRSIKD